MSHTTCDLCWDADGRLPVIVGSDRARLTPDELSLAKELIKSHGLVHFRGFDISIEDFRGWTKQLGCTFASEKWAPHALARRAPGIGLHTEQAHVRCVPASLWFYMAKQTERGGETIVCDGAAIYSSLSRSAQVFLEENDVLYWWRFSKPPLSDTPLENPTDPPGIGREYRKCETELVDGYYDVKTMCKPLIYSRGERRRVFGNQILNTISRGQDSEPPRIDASHQARMPNKERLPSDLVDELRSIASRQYFKCRLEAKDVLWLDNTRFLHGRCAYEGSRQVLARKVFHADQWTSDYKPGSYKDFLAPLSPATPALLKAARGEESAPPEHGSR